MAGIMKDMVQEMSRMSGWADGRVMREPEMRRQFDAMRQQMDEMPKSHFMGSSGK